MRARCIVASLAWGLPSFRTPVNIRRAAQEARENDPHVGKYTLPDGLPEFRAAVAEDVINTAFDHIEAYFPAPKRKN